MFLWYRNYGTHTTLLCDGDRSQTDSASGRLLTPLDYNKTCLNTQSRDLIYVLRTPCFGSLLDTAKTVNLREIFNRLQDDISPICNIYNMKKTISAKKVNVAKTMFHKMFNNKCKTNEYLNEIVTNDVIQKTQPNPPPPKNPQQQQNNNNKKPTH